MCTESKTNFRIISDPFRAFPYQKHELQRLKKTSVEKHVLQESSLKQGQPLHNESGSLDKNYLDSDKTIITLAYMQLSLSFCSVQLRSHIGHMMVSFASQISLLQYETGK